MLIQYFNNMGAILFLVFCYLIISYFLRVNARSKAVEKITAEGG